MEAKTKENVVWDVTPSDLVDFFSEFGGNRFVGNVCTCPPDKIPQFSHHSVVTASNLKTHYSITPLSRKF
jgi:RNA recognition motif-containing protein